MTSQLRKKPNYWLTLKDCETIFEDFKDILDFEETMPPFSSRPEGKLESILESTRQTFGGELLNPTILDASAAYFNNLIRGHPFINGNKRCAVLFTYVFLFINRVTIKISNKGMYNLAILVAKASESGASAEMTKKALRKIIKDYAIDLN